MGPGGIGLARNSDVRLFGFGPFIPLAPSLTEPDAVPAATVFTDQTPRTSKIGKECVEERTASAVSLPKFAAAQLAGIRGTVELH